MYIINTTIMVLFLTGSGYLYKYGIPDYLLKFMGRLNSLKEFFTGYIYQDNNDDNDNKTLPTNNVIQNISEQNNNNNNNTDKYEDKYLNEIRKLNKEWQFSEQELISEQKFIEGYLEISKKNLLERLEEVENEIKKIQKDIQDENDKIDIEDIEVNVNDDIKSEDETNEYREYRIQELKNEFQEIMDKIATEEGLHKMKENANEAGKYFITNKHIERLNDCYVMEKTPSGNVLMLYDTRKASFKYYSDATIPYRYLEPVARKYVKTFHCRPLFVDMEEELRLFEEKWKQQENNETIQEENKENKENINNDKSTINVNVEQDNKETKKSVFTKFKSYNREGGSGKVNIGVPPKNSIPNINIDSSKSKENEKLILKERANRYIYEGKFANFNFLKKIDKSICNKKLNLTFSDFKKMQEQKLK